MRKKASEQHPLSNAQRIAAVSQDSNLAEELMQQMQLRMARIRFERLCQQLKTEFSESTLTESTELAEWPDSVWILSARLDLHLFNLSDKEAVMCYKFEDDPQRSVHVDLLAEQDEYAFQSRVLCSDLKTLAACLRAEGSE